MSVTPHDIKDDEIRIITSECNANTSLRNNHTKRHRIVIVFSIVALIICIAAICCVIFVYHTDSNSPELDFVTNVTPANEENDAPADADFIAPEDMKSGFVTVSDTIVDNVALSIFNPTNLTPTLHIGVDVLNDSTAKFVVQAADVRGDNGGIVGAYVNKGELISKGQAKSGFCAIIGGKITVGVADATPFLEQALKTDGYFFRQYPLVVANQIVENKPKGKSFRKALAELNGEAVVVISREAMTFHDFSQSLVDLGVTNAIYLVGGKSYGYAINEDGQRISFGERLKTMRENTNYIVWR